MEEEGAPEAGLVVAGGDGGSGYVWPGGRQVLRLEELGQGPEARLHDHLHGGEGLGLHLQPLLPAQHHEGPVEDGLLGEDLGVESELGGNPLHGDQVVGAPRGDGLPQHGDHLHHVVTEQQVPLHEVPVVVQGVEGDPLGEALEVHLQEEQEPKEEAEKEEEKEEEEVKEEVDEREEEVEEQEKDEKKLE